MATDAARAAVAPYSPQLDGLRAVAVAAVAWSHWLPGWQFGVPLGAGVHLFFVLSGFLITRILLSVREAPGRPAAIGRFYLRRVLRLFPAFYTVLAAAWLADVPLARTTWAWHAAYLSNVYIALHSAWQGHFSHFWSLAVEEQFYLVWPWLVVWTPPRWLGPALLATVLTGPLSHRVAAAAGLGEPFWALVPWGSADSLGVGAWIAWRAWSSGPSSASKTLARAGALGLAGWVSLAAVEACGVALPAAVAAWRQLLQALVFGTVVWGATLGFDGVAGRILAHRTMVWVGRVSYGVYLVHALAPIVVDRAVARVAPGAELSLGLRAAAAWGVSLALAALLWEVVEAPARRLKARV